MSGRKERVGGTRIGVREGRKKKILWGGGGRERRLPAGNKQSDGEAFTLKKCYVLGKRRGTGTIRRRPEEAETGLVMEGKEG